MDSMGKDTPADNKALLYSQFINHHHPLIIPWISLYFLGGGALGGGTFRFPWHYLVNISNCSWFGGVIKSDLLSRLVGNHHFSNIDSVYPPHRMPVTNKGLGWDSLLKMEESWWWLASWNRYQNLPFLKGVTFSKPSSRVSMLVFRGVILP